MEQFQVYFQMLKKGWWLILLAALAALNLVLVSSYYATPMYRSKASFIVSPGASLLAGQDKEVVDSIEALDKRSIVSTYAEVVKSETVFDQAAVQLGLEDEDLSKFHANAVVLPEASVLELTVEGPDPNISAQLANQIGAISIDYIEGLYLVYNITLLDQAQPSSSPFSPQPVRDSVVAVALGGMFGAMLAILKELLSPPYASWRRQFLRDRRSMAHKRRVAFNQMRAFMDNDEVKSVSFGLLEFINQSDEILSSQAKKTLLRQITAILENELRGKDLISNWNNQRFALVLPDIEALDADEKLNVLVELLSNPIQINEWPEPINLRVNGGLTTWQGETVPVDVIIESVEKGLEQAKATNTAVYIVSPDDAAQAVTQKEPLRSSLTATPTD